MRLWIDDVRPAPEGYVWCKTSFEAICKLLHAVRGSYSIEILDLDHDAGDYVNEGGDYIKILEWLEKVNYSPDVIHIHSMNPVGVENMRRIIKRNKWREI